MDPSTTEAHIRELESVRKQINLWRSGAVAIIFVATLVSVGVLYSDVKTLAQNGPGQERFIKEFQAGLNERVVPSLREEASRTITEMQPVVQSEFMKLNTRVPDITTASLKQLDLLQQSLPATASKTLDETFNTAFRNQEPEIKKMFPDATEEQVKGLLDNMGKVVSTRGEAVANEMLNPHIAAMQSIHANLQKIQASDKSAAATTEDWDLALAVFDVIRDDVKDLALPSKEAAKMIGDAAKRVSDTADQVSETAKQVGEKAKQEGNK